MSEKQPSPSEQAAHDAIYAVEDVQRSEFEPNGRDTTPDWRMWMADGRIADVEVTRAAEKGTRKLLAAGHDQKWCVGELSLEWTVQISDLAPDQNRSLERLAKALRPVLRDVEAEGGTPGEMIARVQERLNAASPSHSPAPQQKEAWLLGRAVLICGCKPAGPDSGCITTFVSPVVGGNLSTTADLAATIQSCIDAKQAKGQLKAAPGHRWLVVIMDEFTLAQMQLRALAKDSLNESYIALANDEAPESAAHLGGITFPGMDEVWAVGPSRAGTWVFVLRLIGTGSNWQLIALRSSAVLGDDWYAVPGLTFWHN